MVDKRSDVLPAALVQYLKEVTKSPVAPSGGIKRKATQAKLEG